MQVISIKPGCIPVLMDALLASFGIESDHELSQKLEKVKSENGLTREEIEERAQEIHPEVSIEDRLAFIKVESEMKMELESEVPIEVTDEQYELIVRSVEEYCAESVEYESRTFDSILYHSVIGVSR